MKSKPLIRFLASPPINDLRFIIENWVEEARVNAGLFSHVHPGVTKTYIPRRVRLLIPRVTCVLTGPEDEPSGFCAYSFERQTLTPIIHAVYVVPPARKRGLGTALLEAAGVGPGVTGWHTTYARGSRMWPSAARGLVQNQLLLDYDPQKPGDPP